MMSKTIRNFKFDERISSSKRCSEILAQTLSKDKQILCRSAKQRRR